MGNDVIFASGTRQLTAAITAGAKATVEHSATPFAQKGPVSSYEGTLSLDIEGTSSAVGKR